MCLEYTYREQAHPRQQHEVAVCGSRVNQFFGDYERDGEEVYYDREVLEPYRQWLDAHTPGWYSWNYKETNCFSFASQEHAMLFKLTWA
jgi:hypothetical protein